MPRNGSGTATLAQAAFVPSTPISSSAMNSDLSDIANMLTGSVASDGQTTITGAFKGFSGSVGAPMYSFSADTDCGMYRIGANNIGFSVNATKIFEMSTAGLGISIATLAVDGTVALPVYSFASDPDSGVYRIGANNIGVAVNAAKVLDISTAGLNVIGSVSSNGAAFSPLAQGAGMVNGTIVESHAGNAVTFAIKTLAGADPSATDIVYCVFRNVTAATGNYVVLQLTAALSLTISSGSTMGFTSGAAGRLWLVLFNDAGTVRLGAINCLSGTSIYPLGQFPIASSTAEGGAGGADSAQVFYTGTAVSSKAYAPIGYASYETGLATAGSWAASPTRLQLHGVDVPLPGTRVQVQRNYTGANNSGGTVLPFDNSIPQNTEGVQFMTQAITPTSAANILEISWTFYISHSAGGTQSTALFQDATANALAAASEYIGSTNVVAAQKGEWAMLAGTTSSTTFKVNSGNANVGTSFFNSIGAGQVFAGVYASNITVTEIMS